jgi:hypothetical protein
MCVVTVCALFLSSGDQSKPMTECERLATAQRIADEEWGKQVQGSLMAQHFLYASMAFYDVAEQRGCFN